MFSWQMIEYNHYVYFKSLWKSWPGEFLTHFDIWMSSFVGGPGAPPEVYRPIRWLQVWKGLCKQQNLGLGLQSQNYHQEKGQAVAGPREGTKDPGDSARTALGHKDMARQTQPPRGQASPRNGFWFEVTFYFPKWCMLSLWMRNFLKQRISFYTWK